MDGSTILKRRSDVRYRVIEDEAVVVRQTDAEVLVLNAVGARVLDLIDGSSPVRTVLDTVLSEYEVEPARLRTDILDFLRQLSEAGVLEPLETQELGAR